MMSRMLKLKRTGMEIVQVSRSVCPLMSFLLKVTEANKVGLLEYTTHSTLVTGSLTDCFSGGKGVRQGCLVSPLSFNCYSEQTIRESVDDLSWIGMRIGSRVINNLRYADDIVLIAQSPQALQLLLDKVHSVSKEYGLGISVKKTKVMAVTTQKEHIHITYQGCQLEQVERFKYLGTIFTERADSSKEICTRLGMVRGIIQSVTHPFMEGQISLQIHQD